MEVDIFSRGFEIIVTAKDGIRRRQDRGTRIQNRGDAGLGNGDSLLLHGFVDSDAVFVAHLVKFVDANHSAVGEDHGTALEVEFACGGIALYRCSQSGSRRTFSGRVNGNGSHLFDEFEQLRFGGSWITEEEYVDITAELHAVG